MRHHNFLSCRALDKTKNRNVNSFSLGKLVLSRSCKTKIIRNWFKRVTVQEVEIYPQLQRARLKGPKREKAGIVNSDQLQYLLEQPSEQTFFLTVLQKAFD